MWGSYFHLNLVQVHGSYSSHVLPDSWSECLRCSSGRPLSCRWGESAVSWHWVTSPRPVASASVHIQWGSGQVPSGISTRCSGFILCYSCPNSSHIFCLWHPFLPVQSSDTLTLGTIYPQVENRPVTGHTSSQRSQSCTAGLSPPENKCFVYFMQLHSFTVEGKCPLFFHGWKHKLGRFACKSCLPH